MIVCDRPYDDDVAWQPRTWAEYRDHATRSFDRDYNMEDVRELAGCAPEHIPNLTDKEQDA